MWEGVGGGGGQPHPSRHAAFQFQLLKNKEKQNKTRKCQHLRSDAGGGTRRGAPAWRAEAKTRRLNPRPPKAMRAAPEEHHPDMAQGNFPQTEALSPPQQSHLGCSHQITSKCSAPKAAGVQPRPRFSCRTPQHHSHPMGRAAGAEKLRGGRQRLSSKPK